MLLLLLLLLVVLLLLQPAHRWQQQWTQAGRVPLLLLLQPVEQPRW
jgi:hypothetical protein